MTWEVMGLTATWRRSPSTAKPTTPRGCSCTGCCTGQPKKDGKRQPGGHSKSIFPIPCPWQDPLTPFKPSLTHLSSKPPALVAPPSPPPSQQLIPALLYPHSSKSPLLAFKLLITCPIHTETCVPPLLVEAFYIIAGYYPISLQSLD